MNAETLMMLIAFGVGFLCGGALVLILDSKDKRNITLDFDEQSQDSQTQQTQQTRGRAHEGPPRLLGSVFKRGEKVKRPDHKKVRRNRTPSYMREVNDAATKGEDFNEY